MSYASYVASPVLLGITKWFRWTLRPLKDDIPLARQMAVPLTVVFPQRLIELGSRLQAYTEGVCSAHQFHQLLRFNLYNFGEARTTVCAVAVTNAGGETLRCEVVPPVVLEPGARYPFMFEVVTTTVRSEEVGIQVEQEAGQYVWVSARSLPTT